MVTQLDVDALNQALTNGEKQVVIDGQSVTYRTISELIAARNDLQEQLNRQATSRRPKRTMLYHAGRGYA